MQAKARQIHIRNRAGGIEPGKNVTELFRMFGYHASRIIKLVKTLQPFVTDRPNHPVT